MNRLFLLVLFLTGGDAVRAQTFEPRERQLILSGDTTAMLRILQVTDAADAKILRSSSLDIDPNDPLLPLLAQRMYLAMRDTANPGVGIAAPQVGINRNVIWVQRFDKEGQPFELYINPEITWRSVLLRKGWEGCLSIPDARSEVRRSYTIKLAYMDKEGNRAEEIIEDFTAVIFQHETDHLNGILFTDRVQEQSRQAVFPLSEKAELSLGQELK